MGFSSLDLRPLSSAAHGSAYLLTHRSWTSRIGTGLRKCNFSRPRRLVTTRPASSSCLRCFITPKRDISKRASSSLRVCPSRRKSSSSRLRRVGSARALKISSTWRGYVTIQSHVKRLRNRLEIRTESARPQDREGLGHRGERRVVLALDHHLQRVQAIGGQDQAVAVVAAGLAEDDVLDRDV